MAHENFIRAHIYSIPDLIQEESEGAYERIQQLFSEEELRHVRKIVMTGCGYSYAAGLNAKYIFERIAGIPAEIPYSIDASRHMDLSVLPNGRETMLIGVSNSGIVARIDETMERFHRFGAMTVVFTEDLHSKCAQYATHKVKVTCPKMKQSLPLRGYMMTLLHCYALAFRIAIAKGTATEAERRHFFREINEQAARLKRGLPEIEHQINLFAEQVKHVYAYEFVGSGMEYAAAWLGRQQMAGQTGKIGVECSTEDWLHSNFFWNEPELVGTMLFMPKHSTSFSREKEVEGYMRHLKRPLCIVTDRETGSCGQSVVVHVPYNGNELLNPMVNMVPVSLLAGKICELIGEDYSRGFRDNWDFSKGGYATQFSSIQILP